MIFEWDEDKARFNTLKHDINFRTACFAFDDPLAFIMDDAKHSTGEARQWLIGDCGKNVLVIVFTVRSGAIRIISARPAGRKERRVYEQKKRV